MRSSGPPVVAALGARGALAGALGQATRLFAADALVRYHHRLLIAALVGAFAAGLTLALAAAVLLLAAALGPILPFGPRVRISFRAAPAAEAFAWTLGLVGGAA